MPFAILFYLLQNDLMEDLFAFFDDDMAFFKVGCGAGLGDVGDLYVVDGNAALLHEAAALALRCDEAGFLHEVSVVGMFSEFAPLPNSARAASCAFRASSAPCTIWVSSNARISFARFSWLPSQLSIFSISSSGRNVSILMHFKTSLSSTFLQYW